jgi:hypothetical protein
MDTAAFAFLLAWGGWMMSIMVLVGSSIYVRLVELHNDKLVAYAVAEARRADFWRRVALDCQEGRAESHKMTIRLPH